MSAPQWVRLYLVPQTDHLNTMPPSVVGLMGGETQGGYVLNPMLEDLTDDEALDKVYTSVGMNIISKTYVWRCQILDHKPEVSDVKSTEFQKSYEEDDGGLG